MSLEVKKMQDHLVALTAFIASPAHVGYLEAKKLEIESTKEEILRYIPDSPTNIALQLQAHGRLDLLEESISTFEVAARTLKQRIDETVERENQAGTTTKI